MERFSAEQVEQIIEQGVQEIAVTAASFADAPARAGRFLTRVALLVDYLRTIEEELPKHQTLVNMTYAKAIQSAGGKNITESKVIAEAEPAYCTAVENQGKAKAHFDWVKRHMENFGEAHVLYRQFANARH
jgi:hypothetical protein